MRLDLAPGVVVVTLSRRNLRALNAKMERHGSLAAILSRNAYDHGGNWLDDIALVVCAEPDAEHYADREPPGTMLPDTEAALRRIDQPPGWA
jgi:hypothetical protein